MGIVFVGGNLALDFVGTLNQRNTTSVEQLGSPTELSNWFTTARILDTAPAAGAGDLVAALSLREALFGVIRALIDGTRMPRADLDAVNLAAEHPPPTVQVTHAGRRHRTGDVRAALAAIARDGLDLFDRDDDGVLKWCADPACTHPFLDRSRGHRRRWCDMAGCGDRAKAAAYRARRHQAQLAADRGTGARRRSTA